MAMAYDHVALHCYSMLLSYLHTFPHLASAVSPVIYKNNIRLNFGSPWSDLHRHMLRPAHLQLTFASKIGLANHNGPKGGHHVINEMD
jgi:hypothetical protein